MRTTEDFLTEHATDGELTAEQATALLEQAMGDTGGMPDSSVAPAAAPVSSQTTTEPQSSATEPEPATPVLMAKDGVHTIPYERLTKATEQAQQYKAQLEAVQAELEAARAAAQQRADAGQAPTQADANLDIAEKAMEAGVDPALFGDFTDEDIAKGVAKLVADSATTLRAQIKDELLAELRQEQQREESSNAHVSAIAAKHPDWQSIEASKELADWIKTKPSWQQKAINDVLDGGSTADCIELLDTYKQETGLAQPKEGGVKAAAQAAVAGARSPAPVSLSDFPGGSAAPSNRFEAAAAMDPVDLADAMAEWSPAQIDQFLNRRL